MYEKLRLVIDILTFLFMVGVFPVFRLLRKIKTNDLKHIDGKLDNIQKSVDKVDKKLDRHLEWHITKGS